ncbi:MAG: DDE-type integrase/transposase/recombinase [Myxococcota bacterium]|nr:DDE-type integrase/transposase/recombinase [Myxococcota bacterium]
MSEETRKQEEVAGPARGASEGDGVAAASAAGRAGGGGGEALTRGPGRPNRLKRTVRPEAHREKEFTGEQRLLMLDTWLRSKLPATEFADLVGVAPHTLYGWRKRFERDGPAGLVGRRKGSTGSRLPEPVRRSILMMKEQHPDWGQDRIHDMLLRSDGLQASPGAIQRVLLEQGYEVQEAPTRPHPPKAHRFEAARPNALWQTDLFTFVLKRERRRVHLVAYLDDFSRFIVGHGLHASASGAMVRESFEEAMANFGAPEEILTDNGTQYVTWRGKSAFSKLCEKRGVKQRVARPRHPQTLGKIERFWGSLWRELLEGAVFRGMEEARRRIAHYIGYYNFQRTHQGIEGLVPADRYFEAAAQVRQALEAHVAENARELALHGEPRKPLYLTGRVGEASVSLHTEGDRVLLTDAEGVRAEVDLKATGKRAEAPGTSELDAVLEDLAEAAEADAGAEADASEEA